MLSDIVIEKENLVESGCANASGGSSPNILQSRSSAPTHPNPSRHSSQLLLPLHKHALALLLTAILVIGVLIAFMVCFWDNLRTCLVWRQLSSRPEGGSPEERLTLVADEHQGTVDEGVPVNEIATRRETDLDEPFRNMVMDIKGIIAPTSAPIAIASRSAPVGPCKFVRTSTPSEFASTSAPKC